MYSCKKITMFKEYFISIPKNKIYPTFDRFSHMLNDEEFKQSVVEELIGEFSSSGFIAFFTVVGGGVAITIHPVAGSIVLIMSIAYGSFIKVFCGRYYKQKRLRNKSPERSSTQKKLEEGILNVFKKWGTSSSMKYFRTNTGKYGFIRLTSQLSSKKRRVAPLVQSTSEIIESSK